MALATMLSGCSTSDVPASPAAATPAAQHVTAAPTPIDQVQREAASPDPNFDYGFTVQITPGGFYPHVLVAACCQPITWHNLTAHATSVAFDVLLVTSPSIPPGGTWVYTPHNVESIAYHSGVDASVTGAVQVNQN